MKILFSLVICVLCCDSFGQSRKAPLDFKGKYLVSVSDADMVSSAYVDGLLGPREGKDALSIIPLAGDYQQWKAIEVPASNSVAGPPSAIAVTPDGRFAFVVETFTQAPESGKTFADFKLGKMLSVIDLANPQAPKESERTEIGVRPTSVSVSPDGNRVAIGMYENGINQLAIIPFEKGKLGKASYFAFPGVAEKEPLNHIEWHPSGKFLAGVFERADVVVFLEVSSSNSTLQIKPWGNTVKTGKFPMKGVFTPDGKYFLVNCLYWGDDVTGTWIDAPKGQINSIRFDEGKESQKIFHSNISTAETSVSPEGITISHDGRWVVTTNLERSYLPYSVQNSDPRITWYSSLTLLSFDPSTGKLQRINDFFYEGMLPEAVVFDASNQYLAVCNNDHFNDAVPGSTIDFWRLVAEKGETAKLVKTNHSVRVTRGVHSLALIK